jgi:hypothetical protein
VSMGFLSKLFGKGRSDAPRSETEAGSSMPPGPVVQGTVVVPTPGPQFPQLTVDDVEYLVDIARSPNGQHMVAWAGPEQTGTGIVASIDGTKVLWHASAAKPEACEISDADVVVYCDVDNIENLSCVFTVVASDGSVTLKHRLHALPNCTAVSTDGLSAVCQLLGSNTDEDSTKVVFFDIGAKSVVWKRTPPAGPADRCSIEGSNQTISLEYKNGIEHSYNFSGKFLSADDWKKDRVMHLYGDQLLEEVEKRLARLTADDRDSRVRLVEALNAGIGKTHSEAMAARMHRKAGELLLQCGDAKAALTKFDAALALNPKIGVRVEADRLRAKLLDPGAGKSG